MSSDAEQRVANGRREQTLEAAYSSRLPFMTSESANMQTAVSATTVTASASHHPRIAMISNVTGKNTFSTADISQDPAGRTPQLALSERARMPGDTVREQCVARRQPSQCGRPRAGAASRARRHPSMRMGWLGMLDGHASVRRRQRSPTRSVAHARSRRRLRRPAVWPTRALATASAP